MLTKIHSRMKTSRFLSILATIHRKIDSAAIRNDSYSKERNSSIPVEILGTNIPTPPSQPTSYGRIASASFLPIISFPDTFLYAPTYRYPLSPMACAPHILFAVIEIAYANLSAICNNSDTHRSQIRGSPWAFTHLHNIELHVIYRIHVIFFQILGSHHFLINNFASYHCSSILPLLIRRQVNLPALVQRKLHSCLFRCRFGVSGSALC